MVVLDEKRGLYALSCILSVLQWVCSHLQTEGCNDGLVVTDSVAHVTSVFVLSDQEWILVESIISRS